MFFKRLHVKCGLRDFWEVAWVAGWVLGSGSGRAAQKQDLDCFSSCFAVLVFEFLSSSAKTFAGGDIELRIVCWVSRIIS